MRTPFFADTLVQRLFQHFSEAIQFQVLLAVANLQDAVSLAEHYSDNADYWRFTG